MPNSHPTMLQMLQFFRSSLGYTLYPLNCPERASSGRGAGAGTLASLRQKHLRLTTVLAVCLALTACDAAMFGKKEVEEPVTAPPPEPVIELPSAEPIIDASKADIRFAQTVLNDLGFDVGVVDGIWGPRSARAIRNFERINGLTSAQGKLSELNLTMLERIGNTQRGDAFAPPERVSGLAARLDKSAPLEQGPQLIIADKAYPLMAKPNPYSEILATLVAGTGIYVIRQQDGWFEVESEDRVRGFIQAN